MTDVTYTYLDFLFDINTKIETMIDCTNYSEKAFLQMLKVNPKYQQVIASASNWEDVILIINSLGLKYTEKQINFIKQNQWYK